MTLSSLNLHFMVILVFILSKFEEVTAIVSPSSIENVCPGEKISLVCSVNGESLKWLVPDPTGVRVNLDRAFIGSLSENTVGERLPIDGDTLGAYAVTLNSVTPNLSSTLEVTLYRSMDGQNIVCSGQSIVMVPIDLYDPPAPASNIHITSTLNNTEESIVSFEWDYFSDGAPVNYSVTVIWGLENDTVSAVTVEMGIELTLRYNTEHAVTVEVISCAESSFSSIFTFKLIRCDAPSSNSAINGMFQITSQAEGGTLTLTCNEGFRSTEPNFATCMQNSLWQPNLQLSQCVSNSTALQCPPLKAPPNGHFIDYEYTNRTSLTGTTVTYRCDSGLFPNDIKSTACIEGGTWSNIPSELTCREEPIHCEIPNEPNNGMIMDYESFNSSLQEGSVINFKCDYGFVLTGEAISICNNSGLWNVIPTCSGREGSTPEWIAAVGATGALFTVFGFTLVAIAGILRKQRAVKRKQATQRSGVIREYSAVTYSVSDSNKAQAVVNRGKSAYTDVSKHLKSPTSTTVLDSFSVNYATVNFEATIRKRAEIMPKVVEEKVDNVIKADMLLDLDKTLVQLGKVQNKWREIGQGLRVPETHIEQVEPYCVNNDTLGMTEMIDFWIRNCTGQPTWRELSIALKSVGEETLAMQLLEIYKTGSLPIELDFEEVPSHFYKHGKSPTPPPLPPRALSPIEEPGAPPCLPPRQDDIKAPPFPPKRIN